MRILFLTNFYPPHELGGQGQSCQQVVEGLRQRGHQCLVLTSMHGTDNTPIKVGGLSRTLYLEMDLVPWRHALTFFTSRHTREQHNLHTFREMYNRFIPDIVFVWGMWNLHRSLAVMAEATCLERVVYRFAEYWPTLPSQHELYWRTPARTWYSRLLKYPLRTIALMMLALERRQTPLAFQHAICVSAATRDTLVEAGIPIEHARIIHTGLDVAQFTTETRTSSERRDDNHLTVLYAGRLTEDKGVAVPIRAVAALIHEHNIRSVQLSIAGDGAYEHELRVLADTLDVSEYISFLGRVPKDEMPALYAQADVLVVPSQWPEPFARVVLEGMISECAVVATATGGTPEIIDDGRNGLLFRPGDVGELASHLVRLKQEADLRRQLASAGRQTVMTQFTITRMMDELEAYLLDVARQHKTNAILYERKASP